MKKIKKRKKNKKKEILGIITLAFSILLTIGIISGNRLLGELGTYIEKYFMHYTFGYSILIITILLFCYGWYILFGKRISNLFKFSSYCLIFMLFISFSLSFFNLISEGEVGDAPKIGGNVGYFMAEKAQMLFGNIGTFIILLTAYIIFAMSIFDVEVGKRYGFIEEKIKSLLSDALSYLKRKYNKRKILLNWKRKQKKEIPPEKLKKPDIEQLPANKEEVEEVKENEESEITFHIDEQKEVMVAENEQIEPGEYELPPIDFLDYPPDVTKKIPQEELLKNAETIEKTLMDFGVSAKVVNVTPGPVITLYEVSPSPVEPAINR